MGLDISLYSKDQRAYDDVRDKAFEEWWETAKDLDDDARDVSREAANLPPFRRDEPVVSTRYPEHLFNRRYLRSSYNESGFNHAVPSLIGTDDTAEYPNARGSLYWIFEPLECGELAEQDIPLLEQCGQRALEVAALLGKSDRLRVTTVAPNLFVGLPTVADTRALAMYRKELEADRITPDSWWMSKDMHVFGGGLNILAAVPGTSTFNVPAVHLIYHLNDEAFDSYVQSAEITAEFCDEAIMLIRRDGGAFLSWSG